MSRRRHHNTSDRENFEHFVSRKRVLVKKKVPAENPITKELRNRIVATGQCDARHTSREARSQDEYVFETVQWAVCRRGSECACADSNVRHSEPILA
jgi:hypothetical protein